MKRSMKLAPPFEKVRLGTLTATDGKALCGRGAREPHPGGEATRPEFGLAGEDAAELGAQPVQLGEKLRSTRH